MTMGEGQQEKDLLPALQQQPLPDAPTLPAETASASDGLLIVQLPPPPIEENVSSCLDSLCERGALSVNKALLLKQKFFKLHERYAHAASKESYAAARLQRLQGQLTHQQEELAEAATKAAQYAERIASLKHEINEKKADVVRSSSRQHMLHQQLAALKAEAQELQGQLETQVKRAAEVETVFIQGASQTIQLLKREEKRLNASIGEPKFERETS
ncbi:hypothetical protein cyc_06865 [Cyclospora cayetanensis]|uniref:Uncharacterized protein n=1 Tax=Cyclospora cayetanensis TaxID=88456 RepID=A0A1D3D8A6_9EIME|nr:hypothetical protein cyc_06865 [Cyclospora cayetanensis]